MKTVCRTLAAFVLIFGLSLSLALAAGPSAPPNTSAAGAALMGVQARAMTAAIQAGKPAMIKVSDPARLKALGLGGLNAGDKVEITPAGEGVWTVKNPKTNEAIKVNLQVQKVE